MIVIYNAIVPGHEQKLIRTELKFIEPILTGRRYRIIKNTPLIIWTTYDKVFSGGFSKMRNFIFIGVEKQLQVVNLKSCSVSKDFKRCRIGYKAILNFKRSGIQP